MSHSHCLKPHGPPAVIFAINAISVAGALVEDQLGGNPMQNSDLEKTCSNPPKKIDTHFFAIVASRVAFIPFLGLAKNQNH